VRIDLLRARPDGDTTLKGAVRPSSRDPLEDLASLAVLGQVLDRGDDVGLLAIRTADGRLAMFFVNEQDSPVDVSLQLSGAAPETFSVTRTDDAAVASAAGTVRLDGGAGQLTLPERSLTTLSSS